MNKSGTSPVMEEFEGPEADLAEQLLSLRRPPGAELKQRIQAIPRRPKQPLWAMPRLVWLSMGLVLAALLYMSPPAEAMWGQVEEFIGRIHLMVTDTLPTPTETVVVESTPMSLAEAEAIAPFDVSLPGYLPATLTGDQEVFVTELDPPLVKIRWRDRADGYVQLTAHERSTADNIIPTRVGPESSHPIFINGQEAVIVYGAWDQTSRTWSYRDQVVTLIWEVDGIQYHLLSVSRVVPLSELVSMAESVEEK